MANVTLRLEVDPRTRRRSVVVSYASDPDALPLEHEEEHRALVEKLLEGGLISAEEAGRVVVQRQSGAEVSLEQGEREAAREARSEGR